MEIFFNGFVFPKDIHRIIVKIIAYCQNFMCKSNIKIIAPLEMVLIHYGSCLDWRKTLCTSFKVEHEFLKGYFYYFFERVVYYILTFLKVIGYWRKYFPGLNFFFS